MIRHAWVTFVLVLFMLIFPPLALAHSHLDSSNPEDGEIVQEPLEQMVLTFDAGIEELSTVELFNEAGLEIELDDIVVSSPDLEATLAQPLENGVYSVSWTVVGEDTHVTEGDFTFTVNVLENEAAGEEAELNEEIAEDVPEQEEDTEEAEPTNDAEHTAEESRTSQGSLLYYILGLGIIAIAVNFLVIRKKKNK